MGSLLHYWPTGKTWLTVEGYRLNLFEVGECFESRDVTDPLQEIELTQQQFHSTPAPELPIFHDGLVGYFGCSTASYIESKLMNSFPPD